MKIQPLDLIVALYIGCIAIAELMGGKTFPLFAIGSVHLTASVAVFVVPLMFTAVDAVVEVYGSSRARSMIASGLIVIALLLLYSLLATHLPPSSRFRPFEAAYDHVFETSARIALASLIAFAASEVLDVVIFARLRTALHQRALWLRTNLANAASQFADTAIFIALAFYAPGHSLTHNLSFLAGLALPYWLLKCACSLFETPLVYYAVRWLRKAEA